MNENADIAFLQWCLPQLGLRWPGFRKVRRIVGKRLKRRLAELGLADLAQYRALLLNTPAEWPRLDAMCRIPISRFYRDRTVFDIVLRQLLPQLAATAIVRSDAVIRCWSAGCASGEEPYTLLIGWRLCIAGDWPTVCLTVIASDADDIMIKRAKATCYAGSSLKELPRGWVERAFIRKGALFCLAPQFRAGIELNQQDIRQSMPDGPFDLILCRNLVFTYFDGALQRRIAVQLRQRLQPGGFLVVGSHETLPGDPAEFGFIATSPGMYQREE